MFDASQVCLFGARGGGGGGGAGGGGGGGRAARAVAGKSIIECIPLCWKVLKTNRGFHQKNRGFHI